MAYYILQTIDTKLSGYIDAIHTDTDSLTPYNFITDRHTGFFRSRVPFSFLFTKFKADEEYPFEIRMLSPDFRMEAKLNREEFEKHGMTLAGTSPDGKLVEAVEISANDFFAGVQYHPEFKSRPDRPHPLFVGFILAALKLNRADHA